MNRLVLSALGVLMIAGGLIVGCLHHAPCPGGACGAGAGGPYSPPGGSYYAPRGGTGGQSLPPGRSPGTGMPSYGSPGSTPGGNVTPGGGGGGNSGGSGTR